MRRILTTGLILLVLLAGLILTSSAAADLGVKEMTLNPFGSAYNVHADAVGNLWINDEVKGELWRVDSSGSGYKVFSVTGIPMDTAPYSSSEVWWVDGQTLHRLNNLNDTTAATQSWTITGSVALWGMTVDSTDKVWLTDSGAASAYRFDPANSNELCTYALPDAARGSYPAVSGNILWVGDNAKGRLIRIDAGLNTFNWWQLPVVNQTNSSPEKVMIDGSSSIWYTDSSLGRIGHLYPITNTLTTFQLPTGQAPFQLAAGEGKIWYTELSLPSLGALDPSAATSSNTPLTPSSSNLTPTCTHLGAPTPGTAATRSGTQAWLANTYTTLVDAGGWTIYQLPQDAFPWGLAITNRIWMVDNFRKVLARINLPNTVDVTACKLSDADGSLATTTDQAPVPGWTVYLSIGNVRQLPGLTTGADGCATWPALATGVVYGVEEETQSGWMALTPTTFSFGTAQPGQTYSHTFVNTRQAKISACKKVDADGNPLTTADQTFTPGWEMVLSSGGSDVGSQLTGQDGCAVWDQLIPGQSYAVREVLKPNWKALTSTSHNFGTVSAGADLTTTFINALNRVSIYLPLVKH